MHPSTVIYLEHDGKVLLVDSNGRGPQQPVKGRVEADCLLRFPTKDEVDALGIEYEEKNLLCLRYNDATYNVVKAYPHVAWPRDWAWKDACASDNAVHPVVRDAVYRSIHRLVSSYGGQRCWRGHDGQGGTRTFQRILDTAGWLHGP